ncbi:MAG: hypothetical protein QG559_643 [Campylobacterota bacterium]|nr:hypothetical protein [Campylobacterota bacterium]
MYNTNSSSKNGGCCMHKNDLKALVEGIYENLLERIDTNENATKEQVIRYLKDAIDVVSVINDKDIDSIEHAKQAFSNSYRELVNQSLSSYEYTNGQFEILTKLQEETLQECHSTEIDLSLVTAKFSEIQSHMTQEIKRANQVITELTNKVKTLEQTSNLDPLTNVFNRRALNSHLSNTLSNKISYDMHVLMLDVDNFKFINDNYGHITGDKILIFIANLLKKTLRDGDKLFRYGGEEFTIILNRNTDSQSEAVAQRILNLISANNLIYLGEKIEVTASIGMTKIIGNDTIETLLSRADKALYISKSNGKNMVSKVYN